MVFYSLTYDSSRRCAVIWMVLYHDDMLPGEAKFDRVLEIRDSDLARDDISDTVIQFKSEFPYSPSIGPFNDVIPCTPRATKLITEIAQIIANNSGYNQGRIDYMREHDV